MVANTSLSHSTDSVAPVAGRAWESAEPTRPLPAATSRGRGRKFGGLAALGVIALGVAWAGWKWNALNPEAGALPIWKVKVVKVLPHDPTAFTQGLTFDNGVLFEGTGRYGQTRLKKIDPATGRTLAEVECDPRIFGEGIEVLGDDLYQLTWQNRVCLVYDKTTLQPRSKRFSYTGEGWGLTTDGKMLYMSDGSSILKVIDPADFKTLRRVRVRDGRRPIEKINELEYMNDEILANVWYEDFVARIDPATGRVLGWIDLRGLLTAAERPDREMVLNGIAYDPATKRLWVTGKNWPKLFQVELATGDGR